MTHARQRMILVAIWLVVVLTTLYLFFFQRAAIQEQLSGALSTSVVIGSLIYLALGSLRGFTLIPATSLLVLGIAFFPPGLLYVLTLVGILVSSASIYVFARSLHLDELASRDGRGRVERLARLLERRELPVIIGWSFFPLAPTDLICYVCGVLRVSFWKCLLGVAIGEGTICALYIFAGDRLLRFLTLK